jgi:hypothetical protein
MIGIQTKDSEGVNPCHVYVRVADHLTPNLSCELDSFTLITRLFSPNILTHDPR